MTLHSIRARVTIWYTLVLAVALAIAGAITYAAVRQQIQRASDASMSSTARTLAAGLADEASESNGVLEVRSANELLTEFRDHERSIILLTPDGREFAGHTLVDPALLHRLATTHTFGFRNATTVRLLLQPLRVGNQAFVLVITQSLAAQQETLADLRNAMLITAPLALLAASLGGYVLARKSLAPVVRMSAKARAISATNLSERIEVVNARDELGELAATLNALLARLDESFAAQRRFMADASHELRSPVAILQGELDVTLSRDDRNAADYRESLEVMRRSVRRLTRIVRDLFLLARSDAGDLPLKRETLYLGELVSQTVRAYRTVAAEREVALVAECDEELVVSGDEDLLQRMTGNLVENAIRYAPRGTEVLIRCAAAGPEARIARIEVRDRGAGVPDELRERIFERFFRVDRARGATPTAGGSGAGLGLPIARWIAAEHGGALRLETSDSTGSLFVVTLPRSSSAV
jgi:heavy metal sensor kinase